MENADATADRAGTTAPATAVVTKTPAEATLPRTATAVACAGHTPVRSFVGSIGHG